jgi:hypothetical protein
MELISRALMYLEFDAWYATMVTEPKALAAMFWEIARRVVIAILPIHSNGHLTRAFS